MHVVFRRLLCFTAVLSAGLTAFTAPPPTERFLTGRALEQRLADEMGVSWSQAKLRDVLTSFSRNSQVAIVLDRRVDPQRSVNFSASALSIRAILEQLGQRNDLGITWLESTAYLGPANSAAILTAMTELDRRALTDFPSEWKKAVLVERPLEWNDLTEPRSLVEGLAAEAGLHVTNLEALPHDLWYRGATAPLSWLQRMRLIVLQFDLTYSIDASAKTLTMMPLPTKSAPSTPPPPKAKTPPVAKSATKASGVQVYTLRIRDVPFSQLLNVLREKHNLKIRVDDEAVRAAGLSLEKRTSIDVERVTLEKLLDQAAEPLGLTAKQVGDTVVITPRK